MNPLSDNQISNRVSSRGIRCFRYRLLTSIWLLSLFLFICITMANAAKGVDHADEFFEWMILAEQGNAQAQFNLAVMYDEGNGVAQDYAQAFYWYKKSAAQGDAKAQLNLGVMHDQGKGMKRNHEKAMSWYKKSSKKAKNPSAQLNIALMYDGGIGVKQDFKKAASWYKKAAKKGIVQAQLNLGVLYFNGTGVTEDVVKAYAWCQLAASQGSETGQKNRELIKSRMFEEQIVAGDTLYKEYYKKYVAPFKKDMNKVKHEKVIREK